MKLPKNGGNKYHKENDAWKPENPKNPLTQLPLVVKPEAPVAFGEKLKKYPQPKNGKVNAFPGAAKDGKKMLPRRKMGGK